MATSVTVVQYGGLAGVETTMRIDAGTPGSERVLRLAASVDDPPDPEQAQIPCCDLFRYEVTIQLPDGTQTRTGTFDGDDSDAFALVQAVQDLEAPPAD